MAFQSPYRSSGAHYRGAWGTRGGIPFGTSKIRGVNNTRDVVSCYMDDPSIIRHVHDDPSIDPTFRDERTEAKVLRRARVIAAIWGEWPADTSAAQIVEADRIMRLGLKVKATHSKTPDGRVLGYARTAPTVDPKALRKLAARFRKLEATKGRAAAESIMRHALSESGLAI